MRDTISSSFGSLPKKCCERRRRRWPCSLILAVDRFLHDAKQSAFVIASEQRIPVRAPDELDDISSPPAKIGFELLDDLAVPRTGPSRRCRLQFTMKNQVVELFTHREADRAERLRFIHFAVAAEHHTFRFSVPASPRACTYFRNFAM